MEKKIFVIANDDGLPGVKKDILNYRKFFQSPFGGSWLDDEIDINLNSSRVDLLLKISHFKSLKLDYIIVVYSGHGGQTRETVLEINPKGEIISESELKYIAPRQLNIFDCCRSYPQITTEGIKARTVSEMITDLLVRPKYDKRILEAVPQQVSLYACAIGEIANDTVDGGAYSKNLIPCSIEKVNEYKLIGNAHIEAAKLTSQEFKDQHPDAVLPRCLTSQQLIIGINPNY